MTRQDPYDDRSCASCRHRGGIVASRACRFAFIPMACLAAALLLAGCQAQPQSSKRPSSNGTYIDRPGGGGGQVDRGGQQNVPSIGQMEPCAARMQDVEGAILLYYAVNRRLPEKLDELKAFADVGTELNFTCPVSGQPYVYSPGGLQSAGRAKRIILHDPTPAHRGNRWCILMAPLKPGQAPYMEVLQMPDALFRTYLPISEQNP